MTGVGVLDYTRQFGVHMLRPEDEVWKDSAVESAKIKPVTLRHPSDLLSGANASDHSIGSTGSLVERIGNEFAIDFCITDGKIAAEVQRRVDAGEAVQFSMGYWAIPDSTPGIFDGKSYQVVQRDIEYNHLALLLDEDGRYPFTQILTDSNSPERRLFLLDGYLETHPQPQEAQTVEKELPNGHKIEVSDADAKHLDSHLTEHASLKSQLSEKNGEIKTLEKKLNDAKGKIMDATAFGDAVSKRLELALEAQPFLDSDVKELAAMSDREIHTAVLIADGSTAEELKDEDDSTILGMYRQLIKTAGESSSNALLDSAQNTSKTKAAKAKGVVVSNFTDAKNKAEAATAQKRKGA